MSLDYCARPKHNKTYPTLPTGDDNWMFEDIEDKPD